MSEDNTNPEEEKELPEEEVAAEQPIDENEEKARHYGWKPKGEWDGEPDEWKSANQFVKTGNLIDKVNSIERENGELKTQLKSVVEYNQRVSQREYEKAKNDLEAGLNQAKDYGDVDEVDNLRTQLTQLTEQENVARNQQWQQHQSQILNAFKERNKSWFNDQHPEMITRATQLDAELRGYFPNDLAALSTAIEERMKIEYPNIVQPGATRQDASISPMQSAVNKSAVGKTGGNSEMTFRKLPKDLKDVYFATKKMIEGNGNLKYSVDDFVAKLKEDGEI